MRTFYLIRHGAAESFSTFFAHGRSDADRALTPRGTTQCLAAANSIRASLKDVKPEVGLRFFTSNLLRAQQTGTILFEELEKLGLCQQKPMTVSGLTPDDTVNKALETIKRYASELDPDQSGYTPVFVTHQPLISALIANLCACPPFDAAMDTASVAMLRAEVIMPGCCDLVATFHHPVGIAAV